MTRAPIPFNRPSITEFDRSLLAQAIDGNHSSGNGPFTKLSESFLEESIHARRALLTTSCTHALEMTALLCSLRPGDEIIIPSFTFVSTANAFALVGAIPVFVDSRSDTLNIDASLIEAAITPRTRAICVVHYGGIACEMRAIVELSRLHNLTLIEDNAHGLFSEYYGRRLGTFGSLSTLSFHETKNITCGEGGALLVNDEVLVERAEILREKGTNRSRFLRGQVDKYTWVDIGSSWVLSDLLAAILWGQLQRADEINALRLEAWNFYNREVAKWADHNGVLTPFVPDGCKHVAHVYHLRFRTGLQRTRFITHMQNQGVSCVFHYQPLHLSPVGRRFGGYLGQCPVSEHAGECLVRLPMFNTLETEDLFRVIDGVCSFQP